MVEVVELTISVGWLDEGDDEQIAELEFDDVETAQKYVDQLNTVAEQNNDPARWFVLCGPVKCETPCGDCDGSPLHHWYSNVTDEHPDGVLECKHGDAWRSITDNDDDFL